MLYCPNFFWNFFCVHIVCNEIQVKVNLEITTFFFYLRFPYCPNFFWFGVVDGFYLFVLFFFCFFLFIIYIYVNALATLCYTVMLIKLNWIELNWNWERERERERWKLRAYTWEIFFGSFLLFSMSRSDAGKNMNTLELLHSHIWSCNSNRKQQFFCCYV